MRRYIDLCADIHEGRRRKLLTQDGCQYADFFFGHRQISAGAVSVTVSNVTAGLPATAALTPSTTLATQALALPGE